MKKIRNWEIWGAVITIIIGSLLHFVFQWSGNNHIVAFFGAVNESTWEHLKLAFWPTFVISLITWFAYGKRIKSFCFAQFIKIVSMPLIIIGLFYLWLVFLTDNFIWDISIFVVAVVLGYYFSYLVLKSKKEIGLGVLSSILILIILVAFSLFTYFPPKNFLFKDPINNGYGIEKPLHN